MYKPAGKYILVELPPLDTEEEEIVNGIIRNKKPVRDNKATVLGLGPELNDSTLNFKVGDPVIFNEDSGYEFKRKGVRYRFIELSDIYAKI